MGKSSQGARQRGRVNTTAKARTAEKEASTARAFDPSVLNREEGRA
jgi:hypothetical protein